MPRFVLLRHESPAGLHWDLMFERAAMLRTWALDRLPVSGQSIAARPLPDHRPAYLDYEGEISDGRGRVERVDRGDYQLEEESPARFAAQVQGTVLRGRIILSRGPSGDFLLRWESAD